MLNFLPKPCKFIYSAIVALVLMLWVYQISYVISVKQNHNEKIKAIKKKADLECIELKQSLFVRLNEDNNILSNTNLLTISKLDRMEEYYFAHILKMKRCLDNISDSKLQKKIFDITSNIAKIYLDGELEPYSRHYFNGALDMFIAGYTVLGIYSDGAIPKGMNNIDYEKQKDKELFADILKDNILSTNSLVTYVLISELHGVDSAQAKEFLAKLPDYQTADAMAYAIISDHDPNEDVESYNSIYPFKCSVKRSDKFQQMVQLVVENEEKENKLIPPLAYALISYVANNWDFNAIVPYPPLLQNYANSLFIAANELKDNSAYDVTSIDKDNFIYITNKYNQLGIFFLEQAISLYKQPNEMYWKEHYPKNHVPNYLMKFWQNDLKIAEDLKKAHSDIKITSKERVMLKVYQDHNLLQSYYYCLVAQEYRAEKYYSDFEEIAQECNKISKFIQEHNLTVDFETQFYMDLVEIKLLEKQKMSSRSEEKKKILRNKILSLPNALQSRYLFDSIYGSLTR